MSEKLYNSLRNIIFEEVELQSLNEVTKKSKEPVVADTKAIDEFFYALDTKLSEILLREYNNSIYSYLDGVEIKGKSKEYKPEAGGYISTATGSFYKSVSPADNFYAKLDENGKVQRLYCGKESEESKIVSDDNTEYIFIKYSVKPKHIRQIFALKNVPIDADIIKKSMVDFFNYIIKKNETYQLSIPIKGSANKAVKNLSVNVKAIKENEFIIHGKRITVNGVSFDGNPEMASQQSPSYPITLEITDENETITTDFFVAIDASNKKQLAIFKLSTAENGEFKYTLPNITLDENGNINDKGMKAIDDSISKFISNSNVVGADVIKKSMVNALTTAKFVDDKSIKNAETTLLENEVPEGSDSFIWFSMELPEEFYDKSFENLRNSFLIDFGEVYGSTALAQALVNANIIEPNPQVILPEASNYPLIDSSIIAKTKGTKKEIKISSKYEKGGKPCSGGLFDSVYNYYITDKRESVPKGYEKGIEAVKWFHEYVTSNEYSIQQGYVNMANLAKDLICGTKSEVSANATKWIDVDKFKSFASKYFTDMNTIVELMTSVDFSNPKLLDKETMEEIYNTFKFGGKESVAESKLQSIIKNKSSKLFKENLYKISNILLNEDVKGMSKKELFSKNEQYIESFLIKFFAQLIVSFLNGNYDGGWEEVSGFKGDPKTLSALAQANKLYFLAFGFFFQIYLQKVEYKGNVPENKRAKELKFEVKGIGIDGVSAFKLNINSALDAKKGTFGITKLSIHVADKFNDR